MKQQLMQSHPVSSNLTSPRTDSLFPIVRPLYNHLRRRTCWLAEYLAYNRIVKNEKIFVTWRRHQMETFSALLALCAGNSQVTGEFPSQRPVTQSLDVFLHRYLNKRLSKQSWGWWFETPSRSLWRHYNDEDGVQGYWYSSSSHSSINIVWVYVQTEIIVIMWTI